MHCDFLFGPFSSGLTAVAANVVEAAAGPRLGRRWPWAGVEPTLAWPEEAGLGLASRLPLKRRPGDAGATG